MVFLQKMDMPKYMDIPEKGFILAPNDTIYVSSDLYRDFDCIEDVKKWCVETITEAGMDSYRRFTKDADDGILWNDFAGRGGITRNFQSESDFFDWCSEAVHSSDRKACQRTQFEGSTPYYVKLWHKDTTSTALVCLHKEGSFDLTPETVAHCFHVANVISVSCFLFCLRIGTFEGVDGSVIDKSRLMGDLSTLLDKWKWGGEECRKTFHEWLEYVDKVDSEKEEAMKLLYQWTCVPLGFVLRCVELEVLGSSRQDYAGVDRASKWGDKLCQFLEDEYWTLFKASDEVEFLYDTMIQCHSSTADLHDILGNHTRATELLGTVKTMLEDVQENDLMATKLVGVKIEYLKPESIERHMFEVRFKLGISHFCENCLNSGVRRSPISESRLKLGEELHRGLDSVETHKNEDGGSLFDRQLEVIVYLTEKSRYSEAREILMQIDLKPLRHRGILLTFLEFLNKDEVAFNLHPRIAPETLEFLCERQQFLLDGSEALLGDRQLTAKFLQQYAQMIDIRSERKLQKFLAGSNSLRLSHLWLKEELNLQLTLPVPECIQRVISCLKDPCEPGEYKRENLSDTLKTYRLLKCSIDIFSELLHNWSTQGTASEVGWLRLLESQRIIHESILSFLFKMMRRCYVIILRCYEILNDSSGGADNGLDLVGTTNSNLLVYRALVQAFRNSALVWVERGRARTLLTQLGPWYNMRYVGGNAGPLQEELIEFYKDEQAALSSIRSCASACNTKTLFIEYVMMIQAKESSQYQEYDDTAPRAFITNEQSQLVGSLSVVNSSCAADGRFDTQVEELLNKFYEMVREFCDTKPLPRRLEDGVVEEQHRILEKLYDLLIEPFSECPLFTHLDPKTTIVFVPDKILYRVPFALLRHKKTQKYLFQLHPIAISPSLRVLQHCEQQFRELEKSPLKSDGCILAVGNVAYEKNLLPGTRKELENLHSCFPGRVKTLEQEEATRAKFLELVHETSRSEEEHAFALIHLAVHGHWSNSDSGKDDPYKTGSLQFAKLPGRSGRSGVGPTTDLSSRLDGRTPQSRPAELDEDELKSSSFGEIRRARAFGEVGAVTRGPDGYRSSAAGDMLPSEDIVNGGFQWRTRLVVLSACNSLRGQVYSDGEVNLPRALMIAGVPAAVVSQWKVSDVGSPRLMKAFYEHLQRGQDVATALQSAMLQLSNDPDSESANNIFEWGPFLVWGLPTVRLPKELLITENARKTLSALQKAESLRRAYNRTDPKELLLKHLEAVSSVLEAVYSKFPLKDETIVDAIIAVGRLLHIFHAHFSPAGDESLYKQAYEESIQLAEEFFTLLPFERLENVELALKNRPTVSCTILYDFRIYMMYTQAMQGNYLIALDYAEKLRMCEEQPYNRAREIWWVNRAVVLRLMGKYEEAVEAFGAVLQYVEDPLYECLIQTSYLKYLMKDKSGALEYALRAKKYEVPEVRKPGYGAFLLSYKALPNEYREWLLNVVDTTGASSSSIWDSLTAQTSKDPTRTTNANKHIEKLRLTFRRARFNETAFKFEMLKALAIVDNFLASAYNKCVLVLEVTVSAVIAVEQVLTFNKHPYLSDEVIALGEEFYSVYLSELCGHSEILIELELEKNFPRSFRSRFQSRLLYTLAMKGNYEVALEYANKMTEDSQNAERCTHDEHEVEHWNGFVGQERAVILRLMGKYDEALKEFDELLTPGEDYECLIQTSYLKHLMQDDDGALEYALRAKTLENSYPGEKYRRPGYGAFTLGIKALPDEYRQWLRNVDPESQGHTALSLSTSVSSLSNVELPEAQVTAETARTAPPAGQQAENLLSCQ